MEGILVIFEQAPVLAGVVYIVTELIKRVWEANVGNIPNRLMPLITTGLGVAVGFLPVVGDPLLGAVIGAASGAVHDIISPRANGPATS